MKKYPSELRVRLNKDDIFVLRAKAAQNGLNVPQFLKKVIYEEKKEEKKRDYRLF